MDICGSLLAGLKTSCRLVGKILTSIPFSFYLGASAVFALKNPERAGDISKFVAEVVKSSSSGLSSKALLSSASAVYENTSFESKGIAIVSGGTYYLFGSKILFAPLGALAALGACDGVKALEIANKGVNILTAHPSRTGAALAGIGAVVATKYITSKISDYVLSFLSTKKKEEKAK